MPAWPTLNYRVRVESSLQEKKKALFIVDRSISMYENSKLLFLKLHFPNVIYSDLSAITSFLVKVNLRQ